MNIKLYFACAIRNSDVAQQVVNDLIVKSAEDRNCEVLAPYAMGMKGLTDQEIYERDLKMIYASNGMIAECSTPSHGVGYEVCFAQLVVHMPILVLYHQSVKLSTMLRPNYSTMVCVYDKLRDIDIFIGRYIAQFAQMETDKD